MSEPRAPTLDAALARIAAVRPSVYARTRNELEGAVSGLSPYITHGFVSLVDVLAGVAERHPIDVEHKFVFELGWRDYFGHVWRHRGDGILHSLHGGPLPDDAYFHDLPLDIRHGRTGVPVVDEAVRTLYATGLLHNHVRMWLASYVVHIRKVHWRVGADWLYSHLLDGDLASNHLSWQWVAGTGSSKPYLFNADNVARYAPTCWHSPGSVIDTSYEVLDRIAHGTAVPGPQARCAVACSPELEEPTLLTEPLEDMGFTAPDAASVAGSAVWLVHPWSLGALPSALPADTRVIGVCVADFHRKWPWSERRWRFVSDRMAELAVERWYGEVIALSAVLKSARRVRTLDEPHAARWIEGWVERVAGPALFPVVNRRCDSFSQWWKRSTRGCKTVADLMAANLGRAP